MSKFCHCLAGISRSAAVALFINERFVEDFINNYDDHNRRVYEMLHYLHKDLTGKELI
jgi:predicted protein tyrosine phosphatase